MLGTNGGGFFGANSAHPFENPTPLTNFDSDAGDLPDPGGIDVHVREDGRRYAARLGAVRRDERAVPGRRVRSLRAASRRAIRFLRSSDLIAAPRLSPAATWRARKSGSASPPARLFATVTTDASCGAVNAMHDSLTPLGGLVPLFNMQTGEVIFGGVGAGLYGMLLFAILAVFIAGLMVGRTPEYLGKKIEGEGSQDGDAGADRDLGRGAGFRRHLFGRQFFEGRILERRSLARDRESEQRRAAWVRARFCICSVQQRGE